MSNIKLILVSIACFIFIGMVSVFSYTCNNIKLHTTDNAFDSYEEFQTIYNTCLQINMDLCNMNKISDTDATFKQFSKTSRMNALRENMNRWIGEYNAKSNMWNRSMWKSKTLPYQLQITDFNCY